MIEAELQSRQVLGYLAGDLRAELIEVRPATKDSFNKMSQCVLTSRGRSVALNFHCAQRLYLQRAGGVDSQHAQMRAVLPEYRGSRLSLGIGEKLDLGVNIDVGVEESRCALRVH